MIINIVQPTDPTLISNITNGQLAYCFPQTNFEANMTLGTGEIGENITINGVSTPYTNNLIINNVNENKSIIINYSVAQTDSYGIYTHFMQDGTFSFNNPNVPTTFTTTSGSTTTIGFIYKDTYSSNAKFRWSSRVDFNGIFGIITSENVGTTGTGLTYNFIGFRNILDGGNYYPVIYTGLIEKSNTTNILSFNFINSLWGGNGSLLTCSNSSTNLGNNNGQIINYELVIAGGMIYLNYNITGYTYINFFNNDQFSCNNFGSSLSEIPLINYNYQFFFLKTNSTPSQTIDLRNLTFNTI